MELTTSASLTADTIRRYREQGFVHIPGVLSPHEVATYLAAARELIDKEDLVIWGASEEVTQVHYVEEAWLKSDALRHLALHPVITAIASRLADRPLRLYSSDILLKKPHRALPTMVHDDEAGLPLAELSQTLTAWIALVDIPVERGCMSFVPGSHLRGDSDRQIHMMSFEEYRPMAEVWPDFDWRPRTTVPVRAGDVTFHHFRTIHMAGANTSDDPRVANGVIYADDTAEYRPGVQDHLLTHLRPGQRLDDEKFPRVG
jgi:ectoine hydroxylase-related dioxygenase (phytanoyl-CoA dioxygenase family)